MRFLTRIVLLLTGIALLLAGCGNEEQRPEELPDARALLEEATNKIQTAESFQLTIDATGYPVAISTGDFALPVDLPLAFEYAEGTFIAPDRLQAVVEVSLGELATTADVVAIGDAQYLRSDVLTQNRWLEEQIVAGFSPQGLIAPEGGISDALNSITGLEMVGETDLDGLPVYHLHGTIDAQNVYSLTFGLIGTTEGMLDVDVYILPEERLVEQVVVYEPLPPNVEGADELEPTTWTITIRNYNGAFVIEVPTPEATDETAEATASPEDATETP